jgi:hypothetical protein
MATLITDTECFPGFWCAGFKVYETKQVIVLEHSARRPLDRARLERLMRAHRIITFNGLSYDMAMIWAAIRGYSTEKLKILNDQIIQGRVRWWELEDLLGFKLPKLNHIDLIEPQPNAIASLKTLNGRLHGKKMQDLPYPIDAILTPEQMDQTIAYMGNDLDATELLFESLKEPLELREAISADLKIDVRSKSDTQVGFAILKKRIEDASGERLGKPVVRLGSTFTYHIPEYIRFQTPQLQEILEQIRAYHFVVKDTGKVELPKFLSATKIKIGDLEYQMGIGGLHSTEANRSVFSTEDAVLIDADVGSYYPAIAINGEMYPPALGKISVSIFRGVRDERIVAKRAKAKTKAEGLKIALNGGLFGNTSNRYSPAYSPVMTIAITLTGQLALLMLIERAESAGITAVSGNTDGVTFLCPKAQANPIENDRLLPWPEDRKISFSSTLKEITDQWMTATGFDLEFVGYKSMHNASVNTYFAIKNDGKVKRKGLYSNPWNDPSAIREQLMKNPNMTICSDAALAFIQHGTPVAQTIRDCADIRQFVTVVNVQGGGTWRGEYLGKVVRFYWGEDGDTILYKTPHATTGNFKKVSKTDGARPLMTLPDKLPADIDYARYIAEANDILIDVGFRAAPPAPVKLKPLKLKPRQALLYACIFP